MSAWCLGPRVADLVDGRLDPAATSRAYAHAALCPRCREAVEAQRAVSRGLASSTAVEPSADLLERLRGIASAPETPAGPLVPLQGDSGLRPSGPAGLRPGAPAGTSRPGGASRARRHRRGRVAIASAAGAMALAVAVVVGGTTTAVTSSVPARPSIAPVVDALADAHATSADQMPFSGPRVVTAGFAASTSSRP